MAENKEKQLLELLEEDDEFEEFENGNWDEIKGDAKEDEQLWQVMSLNDDLILCLTYCNL